MTDDTGFRSRYKRMWEEFGERKAEHYSGRKFAPVSRVGLTNLTRERKVLDLVLSVAHETVLDIGCASGRQVFALAPHCERVTGVDIADSFIRECEVQRRRRQVQNVSFKAATFHDLPDQRFDVVLCAEVLEHVIDLDGDIKRMDGRVRPGGHIVITTPHFNGDGTWWGRLMRLAGSRRFTPLCQFSAEEILRHGDAHVREFSRRDLSILFEKHGYRVKAVGTVSHLDGPWCDTILNGILHRVPWTGSLFAALERVMARAVPVLGRHIVLMAQKPENPPMNESTENGS